MTDTMSNVNAIVPSEEKVHPSTTNQPNKVGQKPKRKGKGAQNKSNEKFRLRKNQKTQNEIDDSISSYLDQLRLNVEKSFGNSTPPFVSKPPIEVKPSTWTLPKLCKQVVDVLDTAGKVKFDQNLTKEDAIHGLQTVSAAQLEAKLYFSRIGTPFLHPWEIGPEYHQRMQYFASLNRNFTPIAGYLEQIGKFSIQGQEFVPWNPDDITVYTENLFTVRALEYVSTNDTGTMRIHSATSHFIPLATLHNPEGLCFDVPDAFGPSGKPIVMRVTNLPGALEHGVIDENQQLLGMVYIPGITEFVEKVTHLDPRPFDFEQQLRAFVELKARSARKFKGALPELDLKSGRGTQAQLVATETVARNHFKRAWSIRDVGTEVLTVGCIFELAPYTEDRQFTIYDPNIAAVDTDIQTRTALSHYVDTIHGEFASNG